MLPLNISHRRNLLCDRSIDPKALNLLEDLHAYRFQLLEEKRILSKKDEKYKTRISQIDKELKSVIGDTKKGTGLKGIYSRIRETYSEVTQRYMNRKKAALTANYLFQLKPVIIFLSILGTLAAAGLIYKVM